MKKIFVFVIVLTFALTFKNAYGSASEEYIIKKGDTLWDISGSRLQDNFLWPKIWKANPQIKNPDLIYPGDRLLIPTEEELRRLELPMEREAPVVEKTPPVPESKAEVEIKVADKEEKPVKYIVDKNTYIASGWLSDDFPSIGKIIASSSDRVIFGNYDIVYLNLRKESAKGEKFMVIRDIKTLEHPETGKNIGHQIRVAGIIEVIDIKDGTPMANVVSAFEDIQVGDGLLPYEDMQPPVAPDVARMPDIDGYIVGSRMNNRAISAGDIIYLDKGKNDALEVGDIFSVFPSASLKIPIGTIQIISLRATTSTAIVLKSKKEISIGDMWGKM